MVVGEKFVFYEAYEEVGVARSHFGSHCNTVDLFVVVVTKRNMSIVKMILFSLRNYRMFRVRGCCL